ncbi:MAG: peptide-methionine (R)-S-oxide reductase MsrB [Acidobacteria bacterium]|nr:peptide-methionine (R)-S-oxide reductase MsrB [Acidobacteriota bacterium]
MKYAVVSIAIVASVSFLVVAGCRESGRTSEADTVVPNAATTPAPGQSNSVSNDEVFDGHVITKTDAEWRAQLTDAEYKVLREADTDPAFHSEYWDNHASGTYYCKACHLKLFTSDTKFESGTGWPSFYRVFNKKNVIEVEDRSLPGEVRTEVICARCKSHLGHVFDDGPKPTGLRYCMNGSALKFEPAK